MKNQLLPFSLILLVASLLTLIGRDVMNEAIVTPLLYFFWVAVLVLQSIPQEFIWGLFLLVAVIITWRSLFRRRIRLKPPLPAPPPEPERIEGWLKLLRQADRETYYKWQLAQRLRKLTIDVLAHEARLTPRQIRRRLTGNQLDLPPDILAYLQASRTSFGHFSTAKRRFFRHSASATPLDLAPERIAQFLEERFNL